MSMPPEEILFYSGIAVMALAAMFAVAAILVFRSRKKRLTQQLEEEFGARRNENHR